MAGFNSALIVYVYRRIGGLEKREMREIGDPRVYRRIGGLERTRTMTLH